MNSFSLYGNNHVVDRLLESSTPDFADDDSSASNINPYTSVGFVVWYCFVIVCCGLPMCCCCACYIYGRCRRRTGNNNAILEEIMETWERHQQHELDIEISRIEANITAFSEQEQKRRKGLLLKVFKDHKMTLTEKQVPSEEKDEAAQPEQSARTCDIDENAVDSVESPQLSDLSTGCAICLGNYEAGDVVVESSNPKCRHLFHEDCIVSWLMTRQSPLCPCCRQEFVDAAYNDSMSLSAVTTIPPTPPLSDDQSVTEDTPSGDLAIAGGSEDVESPLRSDQTTETNEQEEDPVGGSAEVSEAVGMEREPAEPSVLEHSAENEIISAEQDTSESEPDVEDER